MLAEIQLLEPTQDFGLFGLYAPVVRIKCSSSFMVNSRRTSEEIRTEALKFAKDVKIRLLQPGQFDRECLQRIGFYHLGDPEE